MPQNSLKKTVLCKLNAFIILGICIILSCCDFNQWDPYTEPVPSNLPQSLSPITSPDNCDNCVATLMLKYIYKIGGVGQQ